MLTKNEANAYLNLIKNLTDELCKVENTFYTKLQNEDISNNEIYYAMKELNQESASTESVLNRYFDTLKDDDRYISVPKIEINPESLSTDVSLQQENGDSLVSHLCSAEGNSITADSVSSFYRTQGGVVFDLATATIDKTGSENDKNIDVFMWEDPADQFYTQRTTISYDQINQIALDKELDAYEQEL